MEDIDDEEIEKVQVHMCSHYAVLQASHILYYLVTCCTSMVIHTASIMFVALPYCTQLHIAYVVSALPVLYSSHIPSTQMLLSEEEAKIKAQLWYSENADFLKEQECKDL